MLTRRELIAGLLTREPNPFSATVRPTIEDTRTGTQTIRLTFLDGTALFVISDEELPWAKWLSSRVGTRVLLESR